MNNQCGQQVALQAVINKAEDRKLNAEEEDINIQTGLQSSYYSFLSERMLMFVV